jgi:hypothetical protein
MLDRLGGQRVGIVRDVPVLDGDGQPVYGKLGVPVVTEMVTWVDNALFETQSTAETDSAGTRSTTDAGVAVSALDRAWCFLPVSGGHVPANPAAVAVVDITASARIRHGGRDYQMQDAAVLEYDDLGAEDHVFCLVIRRRTTKEE